MQHNLKENRRILLIILLTIQDIHGQDPCLGGNHGTPSFLEKRSPSYEMDSSPICDRYILEGWYGARGYNMSTSPPSLTYCGTLYPVWSNDQPPSDGQTGFVSACQVGFSANCDKSYNIEVKNCGDFIVYKLKPVDLCDSAYCFETPTVITSSVAITTFYAAADETSPDVTYSIHNTASTIVSTTEPIKDVTLQPTYSISESSKDVTNPPTNPSTESSKDVSYPPTNPSTETSIDVSNSSTNPSTESSKDVTNPPTNPSTESSKDVSNSSTNPSTESSKEVTLQPDNPSAESSKDVTYTPSKPTTEPSKAGTPVLSSVQCKGVDHIDVFNDHSGDMKSKMSRALDGNNMTCFQLPLQDDQTPFFLVRISVPETFGTKAIPYDITIAGNGLSCNRHSIARMSQVSYRVVGQPTQFCSLLSDVKISGLSVCKLYCACPNPVSCRDVTIYLASGKNREPWSLCEVFVST
ncbi:uncharacterized protein LOC134281717 [Saccostrea cucullata]|uniref:uncharacterized protein LOC134281717 n=1 Tax=Saccostrea cuccullata TaxID=36930 RepID=UPI002ED4F697